MPRLCCLSPGPRAIEHTMLLYSIVRIAGGALERKQRPCLVYAALCVVGPAPVGPPEGALAPLSAFARARSTRGVNSVCAVFTLRRPVPWFVSSIAPEARSCVCVHAAAGRPSLHTLCRPILWFVYAV